MKILIAYAGKTGGSRSMCELLASLMLRHEVVLFDIVNDKTCPVLGDFDYIVLGGAIRMAKLPRAARTYLKENAEALAEKPHTLFILCAFPEQYENYAEMVFPRNVLEKADECLYFGGELDLSKQRGFDKIVVRMMRNAIRESEDADAMLPGLLPEHVRLLADRLSGR